MMRELNEMQRLAGASSLALELQTKKNQQLQHTIAQMQKSIDLLRSQRDTAEAQIKRLMDDADRLARERDAARDEVKQLRQSILDSLDRWMKEKNTIMESRDRLLDLLERTQAQRDAAQAELNTAIAQSHELGAALVVVEAARAYWAMESTDNREQLGSALGDYALAAFDAARGTK